MPPWGLMRALSMSGSSELRFDEWGGELQIRVEADAAVWTDVGAETATGTGIGDDTVQQAGGADDGIKRTLLEAAAAAVTGAVIDSGYQRAAGVARTERHAEQGRDFLGQGGAAGRAATGPGHAIDHGLRRLAATGEAALAALAIGQQGVDLIDQRVALYLQMDGGIAEG